MLDFPGGSDGKDCLQCKIPKFYPWVGKIPWRRKWQLTLIFLPGESHEQRRLVGCSPWGCEEADMIKQQILSLIFTCGCNTFPDLMEIIFYQAG